MPVSEHYMGGQPFLSRETIANAHKNPESVTPEVSVHAKYSFKLYV